MGLIEEVSKSPKTKKTWTKAERIAEFGNAGIKPEGSSTVWFNDPMDMLSLKSIPKVGSHGVKDPYTGKYKYPPYSSDKVYRSPWDGEHGAPNFSIANVDSAEELLKFYKTGAKPGISGGWWPDHLSPKKTSPEVLEELEKFGVKPSIWNWEK
jgi:hypothetical protein